MSPRTARFRSSAAAAALAATTTLPSTPASLTTQNGSQSPLADVFGENDSENAPLHAGDKHPLSDSEDGAPAPIRPRLTEQPVCDLSGLVAQAIKDCNLSTSTINKLQKFATASAAEQLFMIFLNSELILAKLKDVSDDWEVPQALKMLCRTRIVACILSPHIPEYKGNLVKHITALIPPQSRHLLPDETNSVHRSRFKTFVSDYATIVRSIIKTQIAKSMTKYDLASDADVLDVNQGWCIGRLCNEIVAKVGTDADIQITTEVQSRVALVRFVYKSHPVRAAGNNFWQMVDDTLVDQRKLPPAALAHDVVTGLKDDIARYTVDNAEAYTLVESKTIRAESMQATADKAMRDYYKTVRPKAQRKAAGRQ